jgi:hypothetical protein
MASPQKPEVDWKVSPEIDEYGRKLVDGYRMLFHKHSRVRAELPYVTPDNAEALFEDSPSIIRCVNLNADFLTGRSDPYYHWAVKYAGEGDYTVLDFYANRIITTQEWQNKQRR